MVAHLDITLAGLVNRELKVLSDNMKEKYWEEKEKYWNMLEKKEDNNEEDDGEEQEEEEKDKGKQEDSESVTTESKDEVGEEKGKEESQSILCAEAHKEELGGNKVTPTEGTDNDEEASSSEINPKTVNKKEEKDWQQMLRLVMLLKDEGNFIMKENKFEEASVKFKEAIEYVDILQNTVSAAWSQEENIGIVHFCKPRIL